MDDEQVQRTIRNLRARAKGKRREPSAKALEAVGLRGGRRPAKGTKHGADAVLERLHGSSKGKGRGHAKG